MINKEKKIPLRLIITSDCNGKCNFCHHEGYAPDDGIINMSKEIIDICFDTANELGIEYINFTGGEPTLRNDLAKLINNEYSKFPNVKISMTTNGYKLYEFNKQCTVKLYKINLSLVSFTSDLSKKYQNVKPNDALTNFMNANADTKVLNILVMNENIDELHTFIKYAVENSLNIDFMFNLSSDKSLYEQLKEILYIYAEPVIEQGIIPTLSFKINSNVKMRIKHPLFSSYNNYYICNECSEKKECFEHICGVRVFPNGTVTPCLSQFFCESDTDIKKNIISVYSRIYNSPIVDCQVNPHASLAWQHHK